MKTYTLEIPRPQYDRLGDAVKTFDLDTTFIKFNDTNDKVVFSLTEEQRKRYSKYALKSNKEGSKTSNLYWITQMFLPRNITKYQVGV